MTKLLIWKRGVGWGGGCCRWSAESWLGACNQQGMLCFTFWHDYSSWLDDAGSLPTFHCKSPWISWFQVNPALDVHDTLEVPQLQSDLVVEITYTFIFIEVIASTSNLKSMGFPVMTLKSPDHSSCQCSHSWIIHQIRIIAKIATILCTWFGTNQAPGHPGPKQGPPCDLEQAWYN